MYQWCWQREKRESQYDRVTLFLALFRRWTLSLLPCGKTTTKLFSFDKLRKRFRRPLQFEKAHLSLSADKICRLFIYFSLIFPFFFFVFLKLTTRDGRCGAQFTFHTHAYIRIFFVSISRSSRFPTTASR